jgi:hypothetical protein
MAKFDKNLNKNYELPIFSNISMTKINRNLFGVNQNISYICLEMFN